MGQIVPPPLDASQEIWDRYERYHRRMLVARLIVLISAIFGGLFALWCVMMR